MSAFISAFFSSWRRLMTRSTLPTRRDAAMKNGSTAMERRVRSHCSLNITVKTMTVLTMFDARVTKVPVTACWAPTTSLLSRDISSPVRVAVKKPRDMRCRCP